MNPGVATSVAALNMAVVYGNLTDDVTSYIRLPTLPTALLQHPGEDETRIGDMPLDILIVSLVMSIGLFFGVDLLFACVHKSRVVDRRPEFPDPVQDEVSMVEAP